jgi:hypothetical protein
MVYKFFVEKLNKIYNLNIKPKYVDILSKKCLLNDLNIGLGDLTWETNLGNQIIKQEDKLDTYYYSDDIEYLYYKYKINNDGEIRILNNVLIDITNTLHGNLISWEILSKNIIFKENNDKNFKVIIFYDSFLIATMDLYLKLFNKVYMIKETYNDNYIKSIKPDYVFEFRVERFLY